MMSVEVDARLIFIPDFKGNTTEEIVVAVDSWVRYNPDGANITYEFHDLPQLPEETLYSLKGDCTDIALLTVSILRDYDIQTRLVYGIADEEYHAWYEYKNESSKWDTLENQFFNNLTVIGYDKIW